MASPRPRPSAEVLVVRDLWQRLTTNPGYKLISVFVAIGVWWYVQGDEVQDAKVKAPVAWTLPEGLITTEALPPSVTLSLRGTRSATRRAREASVHLPVDLSDIGVGEHSLEFASFVPVGIAPTIEVTGFSPSSVRFVVDEVAVRKVKVEPMWVGDPATGFTIEEVLVAPPVVEVSGPRSVVAGLREVRTQPIDVSGLAKDGVREVTLDVPRGVQTNSDAPLEARIRVAATLEERVISGVPVHVWGRHDWRPRTELAEITLQGPSASVRGVSQADVALFAHLPDEPDRARYEVPHGPSEGLRLRVLHPGGDDVRVVSVRPPRITVERE